MNPTYDPYKDVVGVYIQLIKRDSLEAGVAIEQIQFTCGARAAVQAALVITLLKMSVKENYQLPDLSIYTGIAQSSPKALPLLRHAVACCYLAWGVVDPNLSLPHFKKSLSVNSSPDAEGDNFGADLSI